MAYLVWKDDERAYIYDKVDGKYTSVKSLGIVTETEANIEKWKWIADNSRDGLNSSNRSMASLWDEYLAYLVANDYSWRTIKTKKECVRPFVLSMDRLRELTRLKCDQWDMALQASTFTKGHNTYPLSKETRAHRLREISAFCGWLKDKGYVKDSPFKVKIPEGRKDAGRALKGQQVHALFESWPLGHWQQHKAAAELAKLFFKIVLYGGTRLSETLGESDDNPGATHENLDRQTCILKLEKTKAGISREVALPKSIVDSIPQGAGPLFFGKITETQLRHYLKEALRLAGITGRFRIHDGRVTCATEWARKNRDPRSAMDQFGWKDHKMAMHYQKVATDERVAQAQNITYA